MSSIDLSNPIVKKIKKIIRDNFTQPPKDFFKDIILSYDSILKSGEINIKSVVRPNTSRNKAYTKEQRIEIILKKDKKRLSDDRYIIPEIADRIILLLEQYKSQLSTPREKVTTRTFDYTNSEETDIDDVVIPTKDTDIMSVKLNKFYNSDMEYVFNDEESPAPFNSSISTLQTLHLKINGILEKSIIPLKRKVICTEITDGVECGNIVRFCDAHLHNKISCTDSTKSSKGHIIKKPESAMVEEMITYYTYEGSDMLNSESEEMIICSLVELKHSDVICNAVYVCENSHQYLLVLAVKEQEIKLLKRPILKHSDTSRHFLDDVYKSIQDYLKEYHNIVLTNQNRYIGQVISFICINNIFFKKRMNSLIIGKSGSGKSIWAELLIPLFTLNYKTVMGTDITRNRFIGGKANIISSSKNSSFSAGYVATQDIIFAEESTNSLKDFKDTQKDQNNNIFHLVKSASGREIDVAIQGGQKVYPKASTILVGNLEQLEFTNTYKYNVANKYKHLSKLHYKESYPLFKPLEYYNEILKDPFLAKAHAIVRRTYKGIAGFHFITRLPPAEQARYSFLITLEDDTDVKRQKRVLRKEEILINPKREQFIKELSEIFFDESGKVKEVPYTLKEEINDYYNDVWFEQRNNFKTIFGKEDNINSHIENNIITIMEQLIWMNKLYNGTEGSEPTLTDEDKITITDFLRYNYNTLSTDEASLKTKPYYMDYNNVSDVTDENIQNRIEAEIEKQSKEEEGMEDLLDE